MFSNFLVAFRRKVDPLGPFVATLMFLVVAVVVDFSGSETWATWTLLGFCVLSLAMFFASSAGGHIRHRRVQNMEAEARQARR